MASLPIPQPNFSIHSVFFLVILWTGLFCIAEINADEGVREVIRKGAHNQREFDYFKLALQWPPTFCRRTRKCCLSNGCCRGSKAPTGFTIHGLWPDYNDGTWPACCSGTRFNVKEISTLLDPLNKYWPSLRCGSSSNCHGGKGIFWEHEWEKHGTCASSVTGDEYSYFLTALNLYFKYNITEVLHEAGYMASNSEKYPSGGIITAIQNAFHATPELQCSGSAVKELRLCFYKDFKPRDCTVELNNEVNSKRSCPRYVSLPEHVLKLGDNETAVLSSSLLSSI